MKATFKSEKTKKLEKTSLNVKFFDWDNLHFTALMKETYFSLLGKPPTFLLKTTSCMDSPYVG